MKRRRFTIICLLVITALLMTAFLFACGDNNGGNPDEGDNGDITPPQTVTTMTPTDAMDNIYNGLIAGGEAIASFNRYGVENEYTINTRIMNYTIGYKANYAANPADSEIYVRIFDNAAHNPRLTFYYNGIDLFFSSGDNGYVLSDFNTMMAFQLFYDACRTLDLSGVFFGDAVGTIFDRGATLNLLTLLSQDNISYNKVGERGEVINISNLNLSIIQDTIADEMDIYFQDVGEKFDILTERFLNFRLSRLLETRFSFIYADNIDVIMQDKVATQTSWDVSGTLRDTTPYSLSAELSYNNGVERLKDDDGNTYSGQYVRSRFTEASIGRNRFVGTMEIPAISDQLFDAALVTNLNGSDNARNEAALLIENANGSTFISGYYRNGTAFADATGFEEWLGGMKNGINQSAIDIRAFGLPKVRFGGVDMTRIIATGYGMLYKAVMALLSGGADVHVDRETYEAIMEHFGNDGENTVYFTIDEELYMLLSEDKRPLMDVFAEMLGVERSQLESFIGEDFFSSAEILVEYNLETGDLTITMFQGQDEYGEDIVIFRLNLVRVEYVGLTFPSDVSPNSSSYASFVLPDRISMEVIAEINIGNHKQTTELSQFWGALIGDPSGKNTQDTLTLNEKLVFLGEIGQEFSGRDEYGQLINKSVMSLTVYRAPRGVNVDDIRDQGTLILRANDSPVADDEILLEFYLPRLGIANGVDNNPDGIKYVMKRAVLTDSFNELLGEDNIFSEENVFSILGDLLAAVGRNSTVSKISRYFQFSLIADGERDPVYNLVGIKDTTASVRARMFFSNINAADVNIEEFNRPEVVTPGSVFAETIYSRNSAWKDSVDVVIGPGQVFAMVPTYTEESTTIVSGKTRYYPTAYLFGKEISYELQIGEEAGTYRVDRLSAVDNIVIIDPAFTDKLPSEISVVFDNGYTGMLGCEIEGFDENNITVAGYNLEGFGKGVNDSMKYKLTIGVNSIMQVTFDVYILVAPRTVVPKTDVVGGETKPLYDSSGKVPVVVTVDIDPYTYAMHKLYDRDFDPIAESIEKQEQTGNLALLFNGYYGTESVPNEPDRDLYFDVPGVNRFTMSQLGLEWRFRAAISYSGMQTYAYATYGDPENGDAVTLAALVRVKRMEVVNIRIDDELPGYYTIDFLKYSTYSIPTFSNPDHNVYLELGSPTSAEGLKRRMVVGNRPENLSDEEYFDNYLEIDLGWEGTPIRVADIPKDGTRRLFGSDNMTYADFGSEFGEFSVGIQRVNLNVDVPSRNPGSDTQQATASVVVKQTVEGGAVVPTNASASVDMAAFPETDGKVYEQYQPFEINPYDESARLPNEIYLWVQRYSSSNEKVPILYPITWVDYNPKDINGSTESLGIIRKDGDGYRLAYPTTSEQTMVVYGRLGDRSQYYGNDDSETSDDYIWVTLLIKNLESGIKSITYVGGDMTVDENGVHRMKIDPYKGYELPTGFTATLESGKTITADSIDWEVFVPYDKETGESTPGEGDWYPVVKPSDPSFDKDAEKFYFNGKFAFGFAPGTYSVRYIIGDESGVRQEVIFEVDTETRILTGNSVNIFGAENGVPTENGLLEIDFYDINSANILARLNELMSDGGRGNGRVLIENAAYTQYITWVTVDDEADENYAYSLNRFIDMLVSGEAGGSMVLHGAIAAGTILEQQLEIQVSMRPYNLVSIGWDYDRVYEDFESGAVSIDEMNNYAVSYDRTRLDDEGYFDMIINVNMPHGLVINGKFTYPKDYFDYLLGSLRLNVGGSNPVKTTVPVVSYGDYATAAAFDRAVYAIYDGVNPSDPEPFAIYLDKLSAGSAVNKIRLTIKPAKEEREGSSLVTVNPDLYDSMGNWAVAAYELPKYADVGYTSTTESGEEFEYTARYDVPAGWTPTNSATFGNAAMKSIPLNMMNSVYNGGEGNKQSTIYFFSFIPDVYSTAAVSLTVNVMQKQLVERDANGNIVGYRFNSGDEDSLYRVTEGVLRISNPFALYTPPTEGNDTGFNKAALLEAISSIDPIVDGVYYQSTQVNTYSNITWTLESKLNFSPAVFTKGIHARTESGLFNKDALLATAEILPYYASSSEKTESRQKIEIYVEVESMGFSGISYGDMPVFDGNIIEIDPYNDVGNYRGQFVLPASGMNVSFTNGVRIVFDGVTYKIADSKGYDIEDDQFNTRYVIGYNYEGVEAHFRQYAEEDGTLNINMYLPNFVDKDGSPKPIGLKLKIMSRKITEALASNVFYNLNEYGALVVSKEVWLPNLYYIDPYNNATFALPDYMSVQYENNSGANVRIPVTDWQILDSERGYVSIDANPDFYTRDGVAFYCGNYSGGVYFLRGSVSVGVDSIGGVNRQTVDLTVVALNRSLRAEYEITHRFTDPVGALLSDIPGKLTEEMFVNYDNYYADYVQDPDNRYSKFGAPLIPTVRWGVDDSVLSIEGGYNKDLDGNIYGVNRNRQRTHDVFSEQYGADYTRLAEARMWDELFIDPVAGTPLSTFEETTADRLGTAFAELEKQVIYRTYMIVRDSFGDSTYAVVMDNLALNVTENSDGWTLADNMPDIAQTIFGNLQREAAEGTINANSRTIYDALVNTYNTFKNDEVSGSLTDPDLMSEYQNMKADKFESVDEIVHISGTDVVRNLSIRMDRALKIYLEADIWEGMYSRALDSERAVMNSVLNGGETPEQKSFALNAYLMYTTVTTGTPGESAVAHVSAPYFAFAGIYEYAPGENPAYPEGKLKEEFVLNVYNNAPFDFDVKAAFDISYWSVFEQLVAEATMAAFEQLRYDTVSESIDEYINRKIAEYINGITAVISDFNYDQFLADSRTGRDPDPNTQRGNWVAWWEKLYGALQKPVDDELEFYKNDADTAQRWDDLRATLFAENEIEDWTLMGIFAEVLDEDPRYAAQANIKWGLITRNPANLGGKSANFFEWGDGNDKILVWKYTRAYFEYIGDSEALETLGETVPGSAGEALAKLNALGKQAYLPSFTEYEWIMRSRRATYNSRASARVDSVEKMFVAYGMVEAHESLIKLINAIASLNPGENHYPRVWKILIDNSSISPEEQAAYDGTEVVGASAALPTLNMSEWRVWRSSDPTTYVDDFIDLDALFDAYVDGFDEYKYDELWNAYREALTESATAEMDDILTRAQNDHKGQAMADIVNRNNIYATGNGGPIADFATAFYNAFGSTILPELLRRLRSSLSGNASSTVQSALDAIGETLDADAARNLFDLMFVNVNADRTTKTRALQIFYWLCQNKNEADTAYGLLKANASTLGNGMTAEKIDEIFALALENSDFLVESDFNVGEAFTEEEFASFAKYLFFYHFMNSSGMDYDALNRESVKEVFAQAYDSLRNSLQNDEARNLLDSVRDAHTGSYNGSIQTAFVNLVNSRAAQGTELNARRQARLQELKDELVETCASEIREQLAASEDEIGATYASYFAEPTDEAEVTALKKEALAAYYEEATDDEKAMIDYQRRVSGEDGAYDALNDREDVSAEFKAALRNRYDGIITTNGLDRIRTEAYNKGSEELAGYNGQLSAFSGYIQTLTGLTGGEADALAEKYALAAVRENYYGEQTAYYGRIVGEIQSAREHDLMVQIYYEYYSVDQALLDEIFDGVREKAAASGTGNYNIGTYNKMLDILKADALSDLNRVTEKTEEEEYAKKLYERLGEYKASALKGGWETKLQDDFVAWKANYDDAMEIITDATIQDEMKTYVGAVFDEYMKEESPDYAEAMTKLAENIVSLSENTVAQLREILELSELDDIGRMLKISVGESRIKAGQPVSGLALDVLTLVKRYELYSLLKDGVDKFDAGILNKVTYGLDGYYDNTDGEFAVQYVNLLLDTLEEMGMNAAKNYVEYLYAEIKQEELDISDKIFEALQKTDDFLNYGMKFENVAEYEQKKTDDILGYVQTAGNMSGAVGSETAAKEFFDTRIKSTVRRYETYYLEQNLAESGGDSSHIVMFDYELGTQSQVIGDSAYIGNANKVSSDRSDGNWYMSGAFRAQNIDYTTGELVLEHIDFAANAAERVNSMLAALENPDGSNSDLRLSLDRLTLDPLAPDLPEQAYAYGFADAGSGTKKYYSFGLIDLTYPTANNSIFDNVYNGTDYDTTGSYYVSTTWAGGSSAPISIQVRHVNRTINNVMVLSKNFGGAEADGGYYTLENDGGKNIFLLNPLNEEIDSEQLVNGQSYRSYLFPNYIRMSFNDPEDAQYHDFRNVEWDLSAISGSNYNLTGKTVDLRILSYDTDVPNEPSYTRHVEFDYARDVVTVTVLDANDRVVGAPRVMNHAPGSDVWNLRVNVIDRMPDTLSIGNVVVGRRTGTNNYIEIDRSLTQYLQNPFNVVLPDPVTDEVKITFGSSTSTFGTDERAGDVFDGGWTIENSAMGLRNLERIITGQETENYTIMTVITYMGYNIRVMFHVDSELHLYLTTNSQNQVEPISGGTIYLVKSDEVGPMQQLRANYSSVYYNFAQDVNQKKYRLVPLYFEQSEIDSNNITTGSTGVYPEVKAILGLDRSVHSGLNLSSNITFTIKVIDPVLKVVYNGEHNPDVILDYLSLPVAGAENQRVDVATEPTGPNSFIYVDGEDVLEFSILEGGKKYNPNDGNVTYSCSYNWVGADERLAATSSGGNNLTMQIRIGMEIYNTSIEEESLERAPSDGTVAKYEWLTYSPSSGEYAIYWPLGTTLRASDLPRLGFSYVDENGDRARGSVGLFWDLDGVNVNRANMDIRGNALNAGYRVVGHYDSLGSWKDVNIVIYIRQVDISSQIVAALGGIATKEYDGKYYILPLDVNSPAMSVLRDDGSKGYLDPSAVTVTYRERGIGQFKPGHYGESADSPATYPIDAGYYEIRVEVEDYNYALREDLVFEFGIVSHGINRNDIEFVGEESGSIGFTYDGNEHILQVDPDSIFKVKVDNWYNSDEERQEMINVYLRANYDLTTAKSLAYQSLYWRVNTAARRYLDYKLSALRAATPGTNDDELNAALLDSLPAGLEICEVIFRMNYSDDEGLIGTRVFYLVDDEIVYINEKCTGSVPVNSGGYTGSLYILASDNYYGNGTTDRTLGNYALYTTGNDRDDVEDPEARSISIRQADVVYAIEDTEMSYSGDPQNPRITNLHDENGRLPQGVTVTYTYTVIGGTGEKIVVVVNRNGVVSGGAAGITEVGTYEVSITIVDELHNYQDTTEPLTGAVAIVKKELYIELGDAETQYLGNVLTPEQYASGSSYVKFNGLVGGDRSSLFGVMSVTIDADRYSMLGSYDIVFNGFRVDANSQYFYTVIEPAVTTEYEGKTYIHIRLKNIGEGGQGSIIGEEGVSAIIAAFNNYEVYVLRRGEYRIVAEPDAVVIGAPGEDGRQDIPTANAAFAQALREIGGGSGVIYLYPLRNAEGGLVAYDKVNVNISGNVTIYGGYVKDAEDNAVIGTIIKGVNVTRGAVTLRIMRFDSTVRGEIGVNIGDKASSRVELNNVVFNGNGVQNAVAVRVSEKFSGQLYITASKFVGLESGVDEIGGSDLLITDSSFINSMYGVRVYGRSGNASGISLRGNTFNGCSEVGILLDTELRASITDNTFENNSVGIRMPTESQTYRNYNSPYNIFSGNIKEVDPF